MAGTNLFSNVNNKSGSTLDYALTDNNGYVYYGKCTGTPPTTANVFQIGCELQQTDGNGSTCVWVNTGSLASPVWSNNSAGALVTSLTAANIIAMYTTPVMIVPAPGAGKAILVDSILFEMTTTSTAFTSGGAVSFAYSGGAGVHSGSIPASVVTAAAGTSYTMLGMPTATNGTTVLANTAVVISNATGVFASGTGTAKVQVWYSVVTL